MSKPVYNTTKEAIKLLKQLNFQMEKTMTKVDKLENFTHSVEVTSDNLKVDITSKKRAAHPKIARFLWACELKASKDYYFTIGATTDAQIFHFKTAESAAILQAYLTYKN